MTVDWTKINPSKIPKSRVNVEEKGKSVPPDTSVSGDTDTVAIGPKKVFKTGYPTGKSVGVMDTNSSHVGANMKLIPLAASYDTRILDDHGVADGSQISVIWHPQDQTVLDGIINQTAYLETNDAKIINVAQYEWPINLAQAVDIRTQLRVPVKHGANIGIIAGRLDDEVVLLKIGNQTMAVPIQDLDPIMVEAE